MTLPSAAKNAGKLVFGYFIENRPSFLQSIDRQVKEVLMKRTEDRLVSIIRDEDYQKPVDKSHNYYTSGNQNMDSSIIRTLMDAGCHFGHSTVKVNPRMTPYILGKRAGIHFIDLDKTVPLLRQACVAVQDMASRGARIVFVGTRPIAQRLTYECAMSCEQYYVNHRWHGGTITNRQSVIGTSFI
jgi:hypothetical protein